MKNEGGFFNLHLAFFIPRRLRGRPPQPPYISPFQSSGSALIERKISRCHLPPPQGSMTSVATTSTRISAKVRPSGSPSRWYAGSSQLKVGKRISDRNRSKPSSTTSSCPQGRLI